MEEEYKLTDMISVHELQELQDTFANATGMAALITDLEHDVTKGSNFTEFCMKYTRGCSEGAKRCNQCDLNGGAEAKATGKPAVYFCHAGLVDFAVPIYIKNKHVGSFIGGQILTKKPMEERFRRVANEIGVDPDEYIEALRKVPIVPEKQVRAAVKLMGYVASKISQDYTSKITLEDVTETTGEKVKNVIANLGSFQQIASDLENINTDLMSEITNIIKLLKDINSVVKSVGNIADETQMISFNASIESARAGEHGKSFAIIANDIRRLAMESKKVVSNIQVYTSSIQKSLNSTSNYSKKSIEAVTDEVRMLENVKGDVDEIFNILTSLSLSTTT
jgi:ligand-binding sensor protein